ncbi:diacylglycerol/lipid kinase family protein [Demequina sediminicola]|uniref:diacylglycerol/lipid kinase family protein n=1 Tax=Demequina sediminicola TaxID=1095026 RepID=UPI000782B69D|nr:diacylglycerol kinase family protein [Demequina sediminicola]
MRRIGFAGNPSADGGAAGAGLDHIQTLLGARGATVVDLSGDSWGDTVARVTAALGVHEGVLSHEHSFDALVVAGGDGMVHLGLQACVPSGVPLGIVATGSGNDFATRMGLAVADPERAVAEIFDGWGSPRKVDVGHITTADGHERWFAGVLSAGIDAAIAERARHMTRPRGTAKYIVAVVRELWGYRPYGMTITVRDERGTEERMSGTFTLAAVSNSGLLGGGIPLCPPSRTDDGRLELVRATPLTRRGIVKIFPRLLRGTHVDDPRVTIGAVSEVTLEASATGFAPPAPSADGEPVGMLPLSVTCVPGALALLAP